MKFFKSLIFSLSVSAEFSRPKWKELLEIWNADASDEGFARKKSRWGNPVSNRFKHHTGMGQFTKSKYLEIYRSYKMKYFKYQLFLLKMKCVCTHVCQNGHLGMTFLLFKGV